MTSPDSSNVFAAARPPQTVRRLPQFIFAGLIVVVLAQLGLSLARGRFERAVTEAHERRHGLYVIVDELRQTTDELTRMARTFVVTGNPVYEGYFNEILAIRDGLKPRPAHYDKVYWDLVIALGQPQATGSSVSLDAIIARAGFAGEELAKLEGLKRGSDQLALLERVAVNAAKGIYRGSDGAFTRRGAPDQGYATRILHGAEYHQGRGRVMLLLHQTQLALEQRTRAEIARAGRNLRALARFETGLIVVAVLLLAGSFIVLSRRLIEPLAQLAASAAAVGRNGFFRRVLVEREDELGAVAGALNRMSETVEEKLHDLEANEERFRNLLMAVPDAVIVSDGDGRITAINPRAEVLLCVGRTEAEGRPLATLLPELGATAQPRRSNATCEITLRPGTAGELKVEAVQNVIDLPDGGGLICTALRDGSTSKAAGEALDRRARLQKGTIDAVPHPLFTTDEAGRISAVNQAFEAVFGLAVEAVAGRSMLDLDFIPDADRRQLAAELGGLALAGTRIDRELQVIARDGFERMMHFSVAAVRLNDESFSGAVVSLMDVTERRRSDADLAATRKDLARSVKEAAALQATIAGLRDESAGLRENTADVRAETASLGAELELARSQLAEALVGVNAAETRAAELKLELEEANTRLVELAISRAQESTEPAESDSSETSTVPDLGEEDGVVEDSLPAAVIEEAKLTSTMEAEEAGLADQDDSDWEIARSVDVDDPSIEQPDAAGVAGTDAAPADEAFANPDGAEPFAKVPESMDPSGEEVASEPLASPREEIVSEASIDSPSEGLMEPGMTPAEGESAMASAPSEPASAVDEATEAQSTAPPPKRKRTPRKKKDKGETQADLFGAYDGAKDEAGPVRVTFDPDGVPAVAGLDLRDAINRLEVPVSAVVRMVVHFAEGLPQTFGELRTQLAAGDHDAARRHAHSLAGTAGSLSADTMRRLAKTLELALKFEQGDAAGLLADLEREAARIMEAARQLAAVVGDALESAPAGGAAPMPLRKLLTVLEELAAVLEEGEIEAIGQAVGRLRSERVPDVLRADYDRLSEMIDNFEYADAAGVVRSMMERVQ